VFRNLVFYRRTGAMVALGVAVATAVIVGSLVVGDSVTGSIRVTALRRLGSVHYAMTAPHFLRAQLAADITGRLIRHGPAVAPAVLTQGRALATRTGAAVPRVHVIGVDAAFWGFFDGAAAPNLAVRSVALNEALARDLGVGEGDTVILSVPRRGAAPAGSFLARRGRSEAVVQIRATVGRILSASEGGDFALDAGTAVPRNAFVSRRWLCQRLGLGDEANTLLGGAGGRKAEPRLERAFGRAAAPADYGLQLTVHEQRGYVSLRSRSLLLTPAHMEAATNAQLRAKAGALSTSIQLAETIRKTGDKGRSIAYAIVAGADAFDPFVVRAGRADKLMDDELLLNAWAAEDLGVKVGDRVEVAHFVAERDGTYPTETRAFTVVGIVELEGPAADPDIVPDFEGITDADNVSDWDPPFPLDLDRVTARDEEYWRKHRATPKAFVSAAAIRSMWRGEGRQGWVTSVRFRPTAGGDLGALRQRLAEGLSFELSMGPARPFFRPVRALALESAKGSTDFATLFLSMSAFLVVSGLGLAGSLMRLSIQRRASQVGAMLAFGFKSRGAGRALLTEGGVLVVIGSLVGVPLGVGYAALVIHALGTWWRGAVGTQALALHVQWASVGIGLAAGVIAGLISVRWSVRGLRRRDVLDLLSGWQAMAVRRPGRGAMILAGVLAAVGLCVAAASALGPRLLGSEGAAGFFISGAALLVAALAGVWLLLALLCRPRDRTLSSVTLALRGVAARRGRSVLVFGLLAAAAFIIVAVAANRRDLSRLDVARKDSGAGGFSLRAESSLPIHYDFGTASGRRKLGFDTQDEPLFEGVRVHSFLLASGADASCLNLAKPAQPRVLGVPDAFIVRGGFSPVTLPPGGVGWPRLSGRARRRAIPAFGDAESVRWQLFSGEHSGLGQAFRIVGESGAGRQLEFVGLLPFSIFASELLVAEEDFRTLFPSEDAPRYFLIETPPGRADAVAEVLRRNLGDLGLEVRGTGEILNELIGVQNTYLSTFLTLGGLGVLMGTVGLVVVVLRNAFERRREFALMLATGFSRRRIAWLLVAENAALLVAGLLCGTGAALVAVAPQLAAVGSSVNWAALGVLLACIMALGMACCVAAAAAGVRGGLIEALRAE